MTSNTFGSSTSGASPHSGRHALMHTKRRLQNFLSTECPENIAVCSEGIRLHGCVETVAVTVKPGRGHHVRMCRTFLIHLGQLRTVDTIVEIICSISDREHHAHPHLERPSGYFWENLAQLSPPRWPGRRRNGDADHRQQCISTWHKHHVPAFAEWESTQGTSRTWRFNADRDIN